MDILEQIYKLKDILNELHTGISLNNEEKCNVILSKDQLELILKCMEWVIINEKRKDEKKQERNEIIIELEAKIEVYKDLIDDLIDKLGDRYD